MVLVLLFALLATASAAGAQNLDNPYEPYDGDTSTTILYHFQEDGGGIEPNEGPMALFGNITGGRWVSNGRFGGGLAMDGLTKIDPARTTLFSSPDLTMEAWVKQTRRDGAVFLIDCTGNDDDGTWGRLLAIDVNGRPFALATQPFVAPRLALSGEAIPLDEWVHIAGVWSESQNQLRILVNGIVKGSGVLAGERGWDRITIGQAQSIPDPRGFVGVIDEVRVSSVVRLLLPVIPTESKSWGAVKALY